MYPYYFRIREFLKILKIIHIYIALFFSKVNADQDFFFCAVRVRISAEGTFFYASCTSGTGTGQEVDPIESRPHIKFEDRPACEMVKGNINNVANVCA